MSDTIKCPVCSRHSWLTVDGLTTHLDKDHDPYVVVSCCGSGKLRYPDEKAARVGLVGAIVGRNRGKNQRRECRVYACPACFGWHLTSTPLASVGAR
jgi:RNase P subunit RPR2